MGLRAIRNLSVVCALAVLAAYVATAVPAQQRYQGPRGRDKRPDFNGIWQTMNTANWDIEAHSVQPTPILELGAIGGVPAGIGVVEGGALPYLPAALKKRDENRANRLKLDPEVQCFLPGIPRATYMPYPFQIVQTPETILMAYSYDSAARIINLDGKEPVMPVDTWMGYSWGRWEGDTLVINTKGFNDRTWFDRSGNFHSEQLEVAERFTPLTADAISYEATMTDPAVFSRPWKMGMTMYRHLDRNAQLLEYNCIRMTEELRYGPLLKTTFK